MVRYLARQVVADLQEKMVFVGGARQVGKTTLAEGLVKEHSGVLLNWDDPQDRTVILRGELPTAPLLVLDELHKYRRWRNLLKGFYDKHRRELQILVTGSARLDYYRYGGDSLQGRFHYLRMHPFTVAELGGGVDNFEQLINLGGFPEPLLSGSKAKADRWSAEYRTRLIHEEIQGLETVQDLSVLELLAVRLPDLVGSPLSINALREDLNVSHRAATRWISILERLYHIFRVSPLGGPKIRAVKKEQKHYHYDWNTIEDKASRFENVVASHLLKWVHFQVDTTGKSWELRYFRDVDGREVDFVIVLKSQPQKIIECKVADTDPSPSLFYLKERYPATEAFQLVAKTDRDFQVKGVRVMPAWKFLGELI